MKPITIMTSSEGAPLPKRVCLRKEELDSLSKEELIEKWLIQDQYINSLKLKAGETENSELVSLRESEEKLKQQQLEATRKENILVMRLTTKEQEMQEYASQIQELKQSALPSLSQLRSSLLDPAVNAMFERMRKEVDSLKARLEETQNELSAWKFTPDSNTGKRLMAKCRLLYVENEELGKLISSGRTAKLEGDLALQRNFSEEMKKSQAELDDFLLELDEDVEGMQSTIYLLQQQLKEAKDQVVKLQAEKLQQSSAVSVINISPSQNGLPHATKRTEAPPPSPPPTLSPPVIVHPPQKEATPPPEKQTQVVKDRYLNGEDPVKGPPPPPPPPVRDVPTQALVRTEDHSLRPNHRLIQSPERTISEPEKVSHIVRTPSPVHASPNGPTVANGECSTSKTPTLSISKPDVPSDESSIEVDITSTSTPSPSSSNMPKIGSPVVENQNSQVQEEAVNLTVTAREMTPPLSVIVRAEAPLKRTPELAASPPRFDKEQFEPASRVDIDIDADTEVQVAQTLACWAASAKKSDTGATTRFVENGEDISSISEGDL